MIATIGIIIFIVLCVLCYFHFNKKNTIFDELEELEIVEEENYNVVNENHVSEEMIEILKVNLQDKKDGYFALKESSEIVKLLKNNKLSINQVKNNFNIISKLAYGTKSDRFLDLFLQLRQSENSINLLSFMLAQEHLMKIKESFAKIENQLNSISFFQLEEMVARIKSNLNYLESEYKIISNNSKLDDRVSEIRNRLIELDKENNKDVILLKELIARQLSLIKDQKDKDAFGCETSFKELNENLDKLDKFIRAYFSCLEMINLNCNCYLRIANDSYDYARISEWKGKNIENVNFLSEQIACKVEITNNINLLIRSSLYGENATRPKRELLQNNFDKIVKTIEDSNQEIMIQNTFVDDVINYSVGRDIYFKKTGLEIKILINKPIK